MSACLCSCAKDIKKRGIFNQYNYGDFMSRFPLRITNDLNICVTIILAVLFSLTKHPHLTGEHWKWHKLTYLWTVNRFDYVAGPFLVWVWLLMKNLRPHSCWPKVRCRIFCYKKARFTLAPCNEGRQNILIKCLIYFAKQDVGCWMTHMSYVPSVLC